MYSTTFQGVSVAPSIRVIFYLGRAPMWAKIASYVKAPMGTYSGDYGNDTELCRSVVQWKS